MILFVGSEKDFFFMEEICNSLNMDIERIEPQRHISDVVNEIILKKDLEFVIYDVNPYIDDANIIVSTIIKIEKANNARPIIYSVAFPDQSLLMETCRMNGLPRYIHSADMDQRRDEFIKCITGFYDNNPMPFLEELEKMTVPQQRKHYISIAFAGCCSRIGTTTQALQLVKYLLFNGHTACYIEMNNNHYVQAVADYFTDSSYNEEIGKVTYMNVDMYNNINYLPDILRMDYEYFIYDLGVYNQGTFNKATFLDKNMRILVAGAKPNELGYVTSVLQDTYYMDVNYIFSFISDTKSSQKDILELMDEKKTMTYFSSYCPDPFVYDGSSKIYGKLLPVDNLNEDHEKSKLFNKLKNVMRKKHGQNKKQPDPGSEETD